MKAYIEATLRTAFPDAQLRVIDTTGGGDHFEIEVIAAEFAGRRMIDQHRMVYDALGDKVGIEIHAVGLRTRAPTPN